MMVLLRCNATPAAGSTNFAPTAAKITAANKAIQVKDAEGKEWKELRPSMNSAAATEYSMSSSYKAKDLINHPLFGLGLVQSVVGPQKIAVLFEDGKKIMRCK